MVCYNYYNKTTQGKVKMNIKALRTEVLSIVSEVEGFKIAGVGTIEFMNLLAMALRFKGKEEVVNLWNAEQMKRSEYFVKLQNK